MVPSIFHSKAFMGLRHVWLFPFASSLGGICGLCAHPVRSCSGTALRSGQKGQETPGLPGFPTAVRRKIKQHAGVGLVRHEHDQCKSSSGKPVLMVATPKLLQGMSHAGRLNCGCGMLGALWQVLTHTALSVMVPAACHGGRRLKVDVFCETRGSMTLWS